jgi:hypothetical protein
LKELLIDPSRFALSVRKYASILLNEPLLITGFSSSAAAFIMSILYGHDIAPFSSDEYISLAEAAQKVLIAAADPGEFYVDLFPIREITQSTYSLHFI